MATFALHAGGGFLLMALVLWQPLTAGVVAFIWGWLREQSYEWGQLKQQWKDFDNHDILRPDIPTEPTFLNVWWYWQTPHKLWEAAQWGIGGQVAGTAAFFLGW